MNKKHNFLTFLHLIISVSTGIVFFIPHYSEAAKLYFSPAAVKSGIGQILEVDVLIDSEGQSINAVQGQVIFPENLLKFSDFSDGNSLINFWIERPNPDSGKIFFSGIVPNGYDSAAGLVLKIYFSPVVGGTGKISFNAGLTTVLLNDGLGTPAGLSLGGADFVISGGKIFQPAAEIDVYPPEAFDPKISNTPEIFGGEFYAVFSAVDKGSGIDHYEIQESKTLQVVPDKWEIAASPYLLADRTLTSYVFVKAVDKAGNERVVLISPKRQFQLINLFLPILLLFLVLLFIRYRVK